MNEESVKDPKTIMKQKKEIGRRFFKFRTLIGKSQTQLAAELDVYQSTITNIERGMTFPAAIYIIYCQRYYDLNPTWLLCGEGSTFISEESGEEILKQPWRKSLLPCHINFNDSMYENYFELLALMQIPAIEKVILGKLTELKIMAKQEIENFNKNNKKLQEVNHVP
jgi:transcriptional regulator with XRE-family HTH domain